MRPCPVAHQGRLHMSRVRTSLSTLLMAAVCAALVLQRPDVVAQSNGTSLQFSGTNQYVTFGPAPGLGASNFTLEVWFKRTGAGATTTTGTGGIAAAVPLLTKGRGEAEASNVDMNYFLGLDGNGRLVADFEEGATGSSPGLNHPVTGTTTVSNNVWYHAAATYDGTWRLYLNGVQEATSVVNQPPRADSIQHAALGSALTSAGVAAGFFAGLLDEARIWNVARTATQIQSARFQQITSAPNLIGRWGMNEGTGTTIAGVGPNGTLTNGPVFVSDTPIDALPPAAPQGVGASAGRSLVTVAWTANGEGDLAGYNVYRSTTSPVATTGTPLNGSTPVTRAVYTDRGLTNGATYFYTVAAVDNAGNVSPASAEVFATPDINAGAALEFNGSNQYVTFGQATGLGSATFTLETWFKRTGTGATTTTSGATGGGLQSAVPLVTKGRGESDGSNVDMNYFLGIDTANNVLAADFEEGPGGTLPGLNHSVLGVTTIPVSTTAWHHAAVTYDGSTWRLYLDGNLEIASPVSGSPTPRFDSIQHAGIGTAMTSTGAAAGFFAGIQDEVRIWNYARTQAEIQATMHEEVTSAPGLLGRWGLNEATGTAAANSAATINGTVVNGAGWVAGYPFLADVTPPASPQGLSATPGGASITLAWTANTEADLRGYNVYRSTTSPVVQGAPLNSAPLTTTGFVDSAVSTGTTYYYVVTAVDLFGNPSEPSSEVSAAPLVPNLPPVVNAGADQTVALPAQATLNGSASDPDAGPGPLSVEWTAVSGPAAVTFTSPQSAATIASFSIAGTYTLRLTATDTAAAISDDIVIVVSDPILVGAGDIAPDCTAGASTANAEAVASLLDGIPGTVFTLGDNAYQDGTAAQFANCYGPTWGRHRARTRPATGNHDYQTAGASAYFDYFNGVGNQDGPAGDRSGGYYSYDIGAWHVVVLNSECAAAPATPTGLWLPGGCAAGSAQETWLRADLAASPTNNIIAMWHKPRFSSSASDATNAFLQPLWQALYEHGVDIILGGHWHNYERLAPTNANGARDDAYGIRQFVVGTGGIPLTGFGTTRGTSEARNNTTHGVLKLTLHAASYDWEFVPISGGSFAESGTASTHGTPPPPAVTGITPAIGPSAGGTSVTVAGTNFGVLTPTSIAFGSSAATSVVCSSATQCTATSPAGTGTVDVRVTVGGQTSAAVPASRFTYNQPPTINAGSDQTITLPASASLSANASDDGVPNPPGALSVAWTKVSGPGTVTFTNAATLTPSVSFSQSGAYVLRVSVSDGLASAFDEVAITVNAAAPMATALSFNGSSQYVTFGPADALGASTLTLEVWFKRASAGVATSTGSGGVTAEPLLTKGRAEQEASNVDMNYFLGIDGTRRVLVADFEDSATGANHPILGTTAILDDLWYHAAATYDGTTWRLYLNGALEAQTTVGGFTPRSDSIQHAALASALDSSGAAAGFFNGTIDEARIWNIARTAAQIAGSMGSEVASASGLIGRWGLNEGFGTTTEDSAGSAVAGTLTNAPAWVTGSPFAHTPLPAGNYALDFTGTAAARDYVTFGAAPALGASTFTIETWFRRDGTGVATSTGSGGITAIPLVTKGMAEADGTSQDMNYFLGIRATDNLLVADFEDTATGANHPVVGTTAIANGVWHHAAATYDGTTWRLYLDGGLETTLTVGNFLPRADSIQHAALATALNSTGGVGSQTQGFFNGALDEARIWNYARSADQIAGGMNRPIVIATGLLGRWGFDGPCRVDDSSGNGLNGTQFGSSWACIAGVPFTASANQAPGVEAGVNQSITLPASASLAATVSDDGVPGPLTIAWSALSGPGTVTFADAASPATTATFSAAGSYVLQLTASDGELATSDSVTITVIPSGAVNQAPVVDAGPDQTIALSASASLVGTVTDDGLPGSDVTTNWTKVSGPGNVTFADATSTSTTATFSAEGTYVLQLGADDGLLSSSDTVTVAVTASASGNSAIDFGGTNAYVTFGAAPSLGAATFTLELWFRRDGTGATADTGSGGMLAVPLVTKGRAQTDASNVDMNYFLGINGNVLAADFEEGAGGATPGLNHPVSGATPLANNTWYHAAATYDGTTWRLYLNGVLDGQLTVGQPPRADSIQHAAIATALNSTGLAAGFFDGVVDEVRIWNYARTAAQIQTAMNLEITEAAGLLARWGLDEGSGTAVVDSTGNGNTGTIVGSAFARVPGTTFRTNQAPAQPTLNAPVNGATGVATSPTLSVAVSDADADAMTVAFLGRPVQSPTAPDFTLVAIPDTQHYVDDATRAPTFTAQTQWIVDNRAALNIAFVSHLGDIVEHIDAVPEEWTRANASLTVLDNNAMKWGLAPGNHDMSSAGIATNYDLTFPVSRFAGYPWYGGYLGSSPEDPINRENKNNYELFSVGGLDFIVIHLEYDMPDYAVAWADRILRQYPNRRAIIATHLFLNASGARPTTVLNRSNGTPAETVWQQIIRTNCNVFLVLNGHYPGEANRTDLNACGQPVHQLASDYQSRSNGGDGWLRYMRFRPSENRIYVYTYSPTLNGGAGQFETDANSQFVLDYNMQGTPYTTIAANTGVASGSNSTATWANLTSGAEYEWYATVSDGQVTTTGPVWRFTTGTPNSAPSVTNPGSQTSAEGAAVSLQIQATDPDSSTLTYSASGLPSGLSIHASTGLISGTVGFDAAATNAVIVTVSDGSLTGSASFTWTVTNTNRAPTATAQSVTMGEDTATAITLAGSDADGDALTFTIASPPSHGSLTGSAPNLTYTPAANYSGADSFTFRVNDGTTQSGPATVSLTITAAPDAPSVTSPGNQTHAEGAVVSLQIQASDPDGPSLSYTAGNLPAGLTINAATGLISGTVAFTAAGEYTVTVTATDPTTLSAGASFTWTITGANAAPVASAASYQTPRNRPLIGTVSATDADGDPLTYALVSLPRKGSVVLDAQTGNFTYTPVNNPNGNDSFSFRANDGQADSNTATITIRFTAAVANTPPVAQNGSFSTNEDIAYSGTLTGTDAEGGTLTFRIGINGSRGTATITNAATGAFTYLPQANANGSDTFTFIVNDGAVDSAPGTIAVTIVAVNDPPVAVPDTATTTVNTPIAINVLANDTDVDGGSRTIAGVTQGANGTAVISGAQILFTPSSDYVGTATFTYQATDGQALSNNATVTVTVTGANQAPAATGPSTVAAAEDTPVSVTLTGSDPEGQPITFSVSSGPGHGTLTGTAPNLTYTPAANYSGSDAFTFVVSDGAAASAPFTVNITVSPINDAPVASDLNITVSPGVAFTGQLIANDVDGPGLTFTLASDAKKGTVTVDANGSFVYTARANAKNSDSFTFRVTDGTLSSTARVTISIR